jgi:hypothetical protein
MAVFTVQRNGESGVSMISTAIVLPLLLFLIIMVIDLVRVLLAYSLVQETLMQTLKIASASAPPADVPIAGPAALIYAPGDPSPLAQRRLKFWQDQLDPSSATYHGKTVYSPRELRILNLAYGIINQRDAGIYFPIPVADPSVPVADDLRGHTNCSVSFNFAPNDAFTVTPPGAPTPFTNTIPNPVPTPPNVVLTANRNRIFSVECRVPLVSFALTGFFIGDYLTVRDSIYAYQSGDIIS